MVPIRCYSLGRCGVPHERHDRGLRVSMLDVPASRVGLDAARRSKALREMRGVMMTVHTDQPKKYQTSWKATCEAHYYDRKQEQAKSMGASADAG